MKAEEVEHLEFVINRLVEVHGENQKTDYIVRAREIIAQENPIMGDISIVNVKQKEEK